MQFLLFGLLLHIQLSIHQRADLEFSSDFDFYVNKITSKVKPQKSLSELLCTYVSVCTSAACNSNAHCNETFYAFL